jgi:cysteine desulfurase
MVTAARLAAEDRVADIDRVGKLRDQLLDGLLAALPGSVETAGALLERGQVSASAASSCASGALQSSHVLGAMGVESELARGSLRLSLGWSSTQTDVDEALAVIPPAVERLQQFGI